MILLGLVLLVLIILALRQQQIACGCITNIVIGLLLIGLGLFLLSAINVIPLDLECEKGSYVSLCLK